MIIKQLINSGTLGIGSISIPACMVQFYRTNCRHVYFIQTVNDENNNQLNKIVIDDEIEKIFLKRRLH